jgi:hypothetical protein
MNRLEYLHRTMFCEWVGEEDTFTMAEEEFKKQERKHAQMIAKANADLRELSEKCHEYGAFDDEE